MSRYHFFLNVFALTALSLLIGNDCTTNGSRMLMTVACMIEAKIKQILMVEVI